VALETVANRQRWELDKGIKQAKQFLHQLKLAQKLNPPSVTGKELLEYHENLVEWLEDLQALRGCLQN